MDFYVSTTRSDELLARLVISKSNIGTQISDWYNIRFEKRPELCSTKRSEMQTVKLNNGVEMPILGFWSIPGKGFKRM